MCDNTSMKHAGRLIKFKRSLYSETHKYAHFCVKSASFCEMLKNLFASVTFQFHSETVQVSSPDPY